MRRWGGGRVFGPQNRNIKQTQPVAIRAGLILKNPEQERALSRLRRGLAPVQVPQQRLARGAGTAVFFRTPEGPQRRVIPLDTFVVRQQRLQGRQQLQALVAVVVAPGGEQGPQVGPLQGRPRLLVLLDQVRVQKKQN